ncbi:MAG: hypothetical protein ACE5IY_18270 [bacterium]
MRRCKQGSLAPLLVLALALFSGTGTLQSQERSVERHLGLTASIQSTQTAILVPIWMGDKLTVAPGIALSYVENTGTTFTLLLVPRFYLQMKRVAPYISANVGVSFIDPTGPADLTDFLFGIGFGGEYFINPKFSLGVEAMVNGRVADISGAKTMSISTGTGVHANVYF